MTWTAIAVLAAGTYVLKSFGPLVIGGRTLPPRLQALLILLPAALLSALVAINTVGGDEELVFDARLPGVLVAGVLAWKKAPFMVVIAVGTITTAVLRQLGMP